MKSALKKQDTLKYVSGPKLGWLDEDVIQLRELSAKHTDEEIAEIMGRTTSSITNKRTTLGIAKYAKYKPGNPLFSRKNECIFP